MRKPTIPAALGMVLLMVGCVAPSRGVDSSEVRRAGQVTEVRSVFEQARKAAAEIEDAGERAYTLGRIAGAQATWGDTQGALETAGQIIEDTEKGEWTPGNIDVPQAEAADVGRTALLAFIAWEQLQAGGPVGAAAIARLALEQPAAALVLDKLSSEGFTRGEIPRFAGAIAKAGEVETALRIASLLQDPFLKAETIWEAQRHAGDRAKAAAALEQFRQIAGSIPDAAALADIAWAQVEAGDVQGALNTAEAIQVAHVKDRTLWYIAVAQARARDVPGAYKTAEAILRAREKAETLRWIAWAQAKAGDVPGAFKTAEAIQDAAEKAGALGWIAEAQAKAGDVPGALQTAEAIQDGGVKVSTFRSIARVQAQAGDVPGALQTAEAIQDASTKDSALSSIAEARAEVGDMDSALKAAEAIQDAYTKNLALIGIAEVQAKGGDMDGALKTVAATQDAHASGNPWPLSRIARVQAQAGDVSGALQTAEAIQNALTKDLTLSSIAEAQAKAGDMDGALKTAEAIQDAGAKLRTFRWIAGVQARAGDVDEALAWAEAQSNPHVKAWALLGVAEGMAKRIEHDGHGAD